MHTSPSWALITGASSGLGSDFARQLAAAGKQLVLTARRQELLDQLAAELRQQYGVRVEVLPLDLGQRNAPTLLCEQLKAKQIDVDILINNAGFGVYGNFLETPWERVEAMLELDILSLVQLTRLLAAPMVARGRGHILQVASIGAYQPCPTYAAYGAAKAFVLHFGEALNHELRGTGVNCTVLSPGVTATEFFAVSGQQQTTYQKIMMMDSPTVVRIGLKSLFKGVPSVVPGLGNKLGVWGLRLMTRPFATAVAALTMKNEPAS